MSITFSEGEVKELHPTMQPVPIEPASLLGTVIDVGTNLPISGVLVEVVGLTSTTTLADGSYQIIDIPPGIYIVRFSHPDYQTLEY